MKRTSQKTGFSVGSFFSCGRSRYLLTRLGCYRRRHGVFRAGLEKMNSPYSLCTGPMALVGRAQYPFQDSLVSSLWHYFISPPPCVLFVNIILEF